MWPRGRDQTDLHPHARRSPATSADPPSSRRPGPHLSWRKRGRPPGRGTGGARPPHRGRPGPGPAGTSSRRRAPPGQPRARRASAPSPPAAGAGWQRPGVGRAAAGGGAAGRHVTRRRGPPGRWDAAPPDRRGARAGGGAWGCRGLRGLHRGRRPGRAEAAGGASASRSRRSRSPSPTRSLARERPHAGHARRQPDTNGRSERGRWRRACAFLPDGRGSGHSPGAELSG